ncbi:hypothetical protein [Mesorhizobium sp. M0217]|uniref:hypothetical protein n=1 Tax=unclassified Mesorhizobium TaxID=325217 RepID=UPI00333BB32D
MPHGDWLRTKLHDIANTFHWSAERRKKGTHQGTVDEWKRLQEAVSSTVQYSDSQKLELSTATEFGAGVRVPDSWDDAAPVPISEEELNACLVPAEFTEGDVEIAKRVLHRLLASVTAMADGMEKWLRVDRRKTSSPRSMGSYVALLGSGARRLKCRLLI